MPIDFHAPENRYAYAMREADDTWIGAMTQLVDARDKRIVHIGCGGGIYSRGWARLVAVEVLGVDFSEQMLAAAAELSGHLPNVSFRSGDAADTGLPDACTDVVFERALIHHVPDIPACVREAHRLLVAGGLYIVQSRSPDHVRLPGSPEHIRGYLFKCFPHLLEIELARRPSGEEFGARLRDGGFQRVETSTLWETVMVYPDFQALAAEVWARTGSILHYLDDGEISELIECLGIRLRHEGPIIEKDPWTVWRAVRGANGPGHED